MPMERFIAWLRYPAQITETDAAFLEELTARHPWFSLAKIVLLRYYRQNGHSDPAAKLENELRLVLSDLSYNRILYPVKNRLITDYEPVIPENNEKFGLIDDFLRKNIGRIVPKEDLDGIAPQNEDMSVCEDVYETAAVSETLARIYAQQGLKERAAEIYMQLSLKNPEKSIYFAELIDRLNESS